MKSKKKNEFEGKVNSLTERIGVSIIGLLTILGVGLIIYTGVKATTYAPEKNDKEYLTIEDTEVSLNETTPSTDESQTTEPEAPETEENKPTDEVTTPEVLETPETPATNTEENQLQEPEASETPQTLEAICNIDGVNVRQEPKTGTTIIGNLIAGDRVTVLNRNYSDEWVQVSFEGQTGYVYHEYLDFE